MSTSALEADFALQLYLLKHAGQWSYPLPLREYRFAPPRRWRADFAWPQQMILLEVEGGLHSRGRHTRGQGYERDLEKYAAAVGAGWTVLRVGAKQIASGEALSILESVLERASGKAPTPRAELVRAEEVAE